MTGRLFDDWLDQREAERAEKREIDRERAGIDRAELHRCLDELDEMLDLERRRAELVASRIPAGCDLDDLHAVVTALIAAGVGPDAFAGVLVEALELARQRGRLQ